MIWLFSSRYRGIVLCSFFCASQCRQGVILLLLSIILITMPISLFDFRPFPNQPLLLGLLEGQEYRCPEPRDLRKEKQHQLVARTISTFSAVTYDSRSQIS